MLFGTLLFVGNALLWVLVFLHLKKKLSPKGIVKEAQKELEALLLQLNSASDRNIRLIQEQIAQLKQACSDAETLCGKVEERIAMLYGELEKASSVKELEERLYPAAPKPKAPVLPPETAAAPQPKATVPEPGPIPQVASRAFPQDDTLNKSYSPLDSYMKEQLRFTAGEVDGMQAEGAEAPVPQEKQPSRTPSVPEFIQAEKPIEITKSFHQQVMEMKKLGYSVEEIARETGRSTQEVKITIEISPE